MTETKATKEQWIAVIGGILGTFMALLDISITNSSMREIQGGLSATLDEGSWISTSYLIAEIIVIPMTGWLTQVFSLKRYVVWSAIGFVISSMLCGLAWDLQSMIVFRFLQGFTGGVLIPITVMIIMSHLPKSQQPLGLTLFSVATSFAPAIGPTVGGWLTVNYSWPLVFYVNLVPGVGLVYVLSRYLKSSPVQLEKLRGADYKGIGLMAIVLSSLTIVLEEGPRKDWFGDDTLFYLSIIGSVAFVWFLFHELTTKTPFINLRLFKRRNFLMASAVATIFGFGAYGSIFLLPYFLAGVRGQNAQDIGYVIMWSGLPQLLIIPIVPKLMKKIDSRILGAIGVLIFGTSALMNSSLTSNWDYDQFFWSQVVRAIGQPLIIAPVSGLAYLGMEMSEMGSASGLFNMVRNLGGSVGIGLLGTLLANRYRLHFNRITESVSALSLPLQNALVTRTHTSVKQTVALIYGSMNRESLVMSFSDSFLVIGILFYIVALLFLFMKKPDGTSAPPPGADH